MKKGLIGKLLIVVLVSLPLASADGPWRQAGPRYSFIFPRDHASHPEYRIEWWYYTGNLTSSEGHRFGYQLTFFRVGLDPKPVNPSRWAIRDLHMAHFAITDIDGKGFRYSEKLNREGADWAGASTSELRVWNEEWQAANDASGVTSLRASDESVTLELSLQPGKRPALHGDGGLSQKGSEAGNSSEYYSLTRMPTKGTMTVSGKKYEVEGLSWMDHEFGTSFLEKQQQGWDWFAIQLDDGSDIMLYRFRRVDGASDIHSSGSFINPDGLVTAIGPSGFSLRPLGAWKSPETKAEYPTSWRLTVPGRQIDLEIVAAVQNQELQTSQSTGVTYWEGPIAVSGQTNGRPISGKGYLEMTGYAGRAMGAVFGP